MGIEEILKKATIKFPRSLSLREARNLINYIAIELPGDVRYRYSQHMTAGHPGGSDKFIEDEGTSKITGAVVKHKRETMTFDSFEFMHAEDDTSKLSAIQFSLVPGREPEDYRSEVQQLWDDVGEAVKSYFKYNKE